MTRRLGLMQAASAWLPPEAVGVLGVLTHLGDPPVLLAVATLVYWVRDRERGAALLSLTIGALALVVALKATFGLSRPPVAFRAIPADGYGFPSGHALGAGAVFGGLAVYTDAWSWTTRATVAGSLISVVAVSRVGLGVHYAVDVIAGVAFGLLFLVLHRVVLDRDGTRGFSLAVGVAVAGLLIAGPTRDALALVGLAVGGLLAVWLTPTPPVAGDRRDIQYVAAGLPVAVVLGVAAGGPWTPIPLVPVAGIALTAGIIALPCLPSRRPVVHGSR